MPISSGALDWPVSYYTKPTAVEDVANVYDNLDPWYRRYAYRNWTWKRKRNTRKKKKVYVGVFCAYVVNIYKFNFINVTFLCDVWE